MKLDRLKEDLDQMRAAAMEAREFVGEMTIEQFLGDRRTQMAVAMSLVLIGEGASRIVARNPDFPVEHPDIPWTKMRGMRNLAVHDYYQLELPIVFDTVRIALPDLLQKLDALHHWRPQGE
ncbi:hypothetical protein CYG48_09885 [Neorhizobium sp. SOG26]|uniref:HepT-like ribonuclease domain-containing protein n=1 Tax=Neorhizobium sp. SOG26 TaxID=2060726 RepID=UPI000E596FC6|nr:HepT-like ribonuclease domain-containing protein [Neorhizobium sp. SOG26]AXV15978.1 hypothetical protein CYG48_09885 [Neorhizobium sp. SOG26]